MKEKYHFPLSELQFTWEKKKTPNQVYSFTELEFDSKHKKLKEYPDELMQKTQFKSQVGLSKFRK